MQLTEYEALEAYAKMMNTLSVEPIRSLLDDGFVYESQAVLQPIESKQAFLDYMIPKLQTIARGNATVYAEMGTVEAYGEKQPCVVIAQYDPENLIALVLAKVSNNKLQRIDLCVVPPPQAAQRSGEYPK